MKSNKKFTIVEVIFAAAVAVFLVLTLVKCNKEEDIKPNTEIQGFKTQVKLSPALPVGWTRYLYVDQSDTTNFNVLARYCKQNNIKGVYMYSTSSIIDNQSNWTSWGNKMKVLSDSGVTVRAVAMGSPSRITSTGSLTRYNKAQTDSSKLVNRYNLENEFWNNATSYSNWISQMSTIYSARNSSDFYIGWFKNLGTKPDTIAAKEMIQNSARVLIHAYQPNMPSASYLRSRFEVFAKGGRQANEKVRFYIIVSTEQKAWGAQNDFSGNILRSYGSYDTFEAVLYNNTILPAINALPSDLKQWVEVAGVIYFTKRYNYRAIPPR